MVGYSAKFAGAGCISDAGSDKYDTSRAIPCDISDTKRQCDISQLAPNSENNPVVAQLFEYPCDANDSGLPGKPIGRFYTQLQIGDGWLDCENGADEQNLKEQCTKEKYLTFCKGVDEKQKGVKCIHVNKVGDGKIDCPNGWDETKEAVKSDCQKSVGLFSCGISVNEKTCTKENVLL